MNSSVFSLYLDCLLRLIVCKEGWGEGIYCKKRCDLSLFQLGLRLLEHLLNEELPIPVQFMSPFSRKKVYGGEIPTQGEQREQTRHDTCPLSVRDKVLKA